MFSRLYTVHDKNYAAAIFCAAPAPYVRARACARAARALDSPRPATYVTILNGHFLGGAKLRLECNTANHVKKEQRQVNKKIL